MKEIGNLIKYFFYSYLNKYSDFDDEKLKEECYNSVSSLLNKYNIMYNEDDLFFKVEEIFHDITSMDYYTDDEMDIDIEVGILDKKYDDITSILSRLKLESEFNNFKKIIDYGKFDTNFIDESKQVKYLKTRPQPEQRTEQWYKMRMQMITASEAFMALRSNIKSYILKKCGIGNKFMGNTATRWGQQYEDVAVMIYEKYTKRKVTEFGLIQHPTLSIFGASPDGITDDGRMLEIKCPYSRKLTGEPLHHYWIQTQIQLEVCNLSKCDFFECTLKEYSDFDEWIESQKQPFKEKGVMVGYLTNDPDNRKFLYCPLNLSDKDMLKWVNNHTVDYELNKEEKYKEYDFRVYWWLLKEVSLNTIHRDKEWFNANYSKFKDSWEKVLHYRKTGCEDLLKKPKTLTINFEKKNEICLMNDSDSDSE
jgi:putative phage-type endonuclease